MYELEREQKVIVSQVTRHPSSPESGPARAKKPKRQLFSISSLVSQVALTPLVVLTLLVFNMLTIPRPVN